MTISAKRNPAACIKTLCNLASSKRAFMILWNPDEIHRDYWFVHVYLFGLSLVYFSLTTTCDSDGPEDEGLDYGAKYEEFVEMAGAR